MIPKWKDKQLYCFPSTIGQGWNDLISQFSAPWAG